LRKDLAAEELSFVEIAALRALLRMSGRRGRGKYKQQRQDSVFHSVPPAMFRVSTGNHR
jgi:hypothetical protein